MADVEVILKTTGINEIDLANAKIKELKNKVKELSTSTKTSEVQVDGLSKKLLTLNTRALAAQFSITALAFGLVRYVKQSEEAYRKTEEFNEKLNIQRLLIEQNESAWNRFTNSVGKVVTNIKAAVAEQKLHNEMQKDAIKIVVGHATTVDTLTRSQRRRVEVLTEEFTKNQILVFQLKEQQKEFEKLSSWYDILSKNVDDRIELLKAELNGTADIVSLQISQRDELKNLDNRINEDKIVTLKEIEIRDKLIEKHKEEEKAFIELRNARKKDTEEKEKNIESTKKEIDAIKELNKRLEDLANLKAQGITTIHVAGGGFMNVEDIEKQLKNTQNKILKNS